MHHFHQNVKTFEYLTIYSNITIVILKALQPSCSSVLGYIETMIAEL